MDTPLNNFCCISPVDTGRKLNVHKKFTRRPERPLNALRTFNLRPVSRGRYQEFTGKNTSKTSRSSLVCRCSLKKVFLKISQISQENTCDGLSLSIKLQASGPSLY